MRTCNGNLEAHDLRDWFDTALTAREREFVLASFKPFVLGNYEGIPDQSEQGRFYLLEAKVAYEPSKAAQAFFLSTLASWCPWSTQYELRSKFADKLGQLIPALNSLKNADADTIWATHLVLGEEVKACYRRRAEPGELEAAVEAARRQISIQEAAIRAFRQTDADRFSWQVEQAERMRQMASRQEGYADSGFYTQMMLDAYEKDGAYGFSHVSRRPGPLHSGAKQLLIVLEKKGNLAEALEIATYMRDQEWGDQNDLTKRIARLRKKQKLKPETDSGEVQGEIAYFYLDNWWRRVFRPRV